MDLPTAYNPKEVEDKIYALWLKSGFFNPDNLPAPSIRQAKNRKKTFTIVVPPPNVTGILHMGHALNASIQDILIRKKRMEGYATLWLPGIDHAGIATQNVVEKDLKKQGISRHDLGKEKFLEKVWEWKEKYGHIILDQFKKLGSSMDWSRQRFTMDAEYQTAVKETFLHYYNKGLIYKAERVINWCIRCSTSLSDLELEYKEENAILYQIKYPLADKSGFIIVATTRPETMLGDSAVAVNPKDERYKNLIGKRAILPIKNREIPIIADRMIDLNFGTGAVKVTPAHDLLDAEIGQKNKLPVYKIIGQNGRMTKEAGEGYEGLKIDEARQKVLEELRGQNLLQKEEPYLHNIARCYRCNTVIEPLPSMQWFLKMDGLAKSAIKAVKSGKVKFHPKKWEKIYFDWLKNIKDWCISRQLWWGHQIPVENSTDVLDTWFSSALWPLATLGWPPSPEKKASLAPSGRAVKSDFKKFYPTQVLSTARDIINLWVARMIFSGLELAKKEPFSDVIIHATILAKDGRRMSKSLGTGVDPMDLINLYGADSTRFGLIWQAMGGQDIRWSEEHVIAGKKFCNKIWNASRFVFGQIGDSPVALRSETSGSKTWAKGDGPKSQTPADKKILKNFEKIKSKISKSIDEYRFGEALRDIYNFFWHEFCDQYIEAAKKQMQGEKNKKNTRQILLYLLSDSLKILHPFMPFITEEIYQMLPLKNKKDYLMVEDWPSASLN